MIPDSCWIFYALVLHVFGVVVGHVGISSFTNCGDLGLQNDVQLHFIRSIYYNDSIYAFGGEISDSKHSEYSTNINQYKLTLDTCKNDKKTMNNWKTIATASQG